MLGFRKLDDLPICFPSHEASWVMPKYKLSDFIVGQEQDTEGYSGQEPHQSKRITQLT